MINNLLSLIAGLLVTFIFIILAYSLHRGTSAEAFRKKIYKKLLYALLLFTFAILNFILAKIYRQQLLWLVGNLSFLFAMLIIYIRTWEAYHQQ